MEFNMEDLKKKAIELGQTGLNLAQAGVDKGVQLAAIAKLKGENLKEESNLRAAYVELGKLYYADHSEAPEENYAAVCALIADIQAAIAANNAKIAEIKITPEVEVEVEAEPEAEAAPAEETPEAPEAAPAEEPAAEEDGDYGFTG